MRTDVAACNGSSVATVELGQETSDGDGRYGRAWVLVRQIQAQTPLQLERLEELLEEWECMGVICRDDTRLEVAFCLSVSDALEDEY